MKMRRFQRTDNPNRVYIFYKKTKERQDRKNINLHSSSYARKKHECTIRRKICQVIQSDISFFQKTIPSKRSECKNILNVKLKTS